MDLTGALKTTWRCSPRLTRKMALGVEARFGDERLDWRHSDHLTKTVVVCGEVCLRAEGQGRRRLAHLMRKVVVGVVTLYGPGTSNLAQMACFDVEERDLPPVAQLVDSYGP